jgi:hypothetical protein
VVVLDEEARMVKIGEAEFEEPVGAVESALEWPRRS